ncbi:hypothetical protein GSUB_17330 (plasmid) [Geoalkalibacter subterraneus]|uniref:Uncharacterized protein n=1 Tax=Geoalkalibacter subterraneus TaxID=483547 RepID=A0A0B5FJ92_9BACT|nr:hypothetical protein GSUB_17330 [Geoalkalibacter subterraneus]
MLRNSGAVNEGEFEEFARDHIEHFGAIPLEFEDSCGIEISAAQCWSLAQGLGLLGLLPAKEGCLA